VEGGEGGVESPGGYSDRYLGLRKMSAETPLHNLPRSLFRAETLTLKLAPLQLQSLLSPSIGQAIHNCGSNTGRDWIRPPKSLVVHILSFRRVFRPWSRQAWESPP
jgi:hypothetical protein